jgi:hypothetical protein
VWQILSRLATAEGIGSDDSTQDQMKRELRAAVVDGSDDLKGTYDQLNQQIRMAGLRPWRSCTGPPLKNSNRR